MKRVPANIFSHAAIYLVARGLPGIIAFVAIPLFTRLLAPADYGKYALVVATASLVNGLFFQWLRLSLVRYLPAHGNDPSRLKSTLATTTALLVLTACCTAALIYILPLSRAWRDVIWPCFVLLSAQAAFELCCEFTRASLRPWQYMCLQLARSSATVVLGAVLVFGGAGWRGPVLGTSAGMGLAAAWAWRRDWVGVRFAIHHPTLRQIRDYGVPLSMTVALTVVIASCDRFIIAWYLGDRAAGLYSVAVDFPTQTLTLLMMVVNLAVFPAAIRALEHQGPEAARDQMRINASLLLAVGLPAALGLSILAPGVANCFLGASYRAPAVAIMPWIAGGALLAGAKAYHFDAAFQFVHRTMDQVWIVLFVAVLNVAMNLVAVPRWGIVGSAAASALAYLVSILMAALLGRRHFSLPLPTRPIAQVVAATAAMGALLFPFRRFHDPKALAAQVAGGALVYGAALLAMNFQGLGRNLINRLSAAGRVSRQDGASAPTLAESV